MFIKVGRVYWIKPKPIPGFPSKERPGIVIAKYDKGKTIFLHLGSSEFKEKKSKLATEIIKDSIKSSTFRPKNPNSKTFVHLDASKPEWNTSIIKPHFKGGYVDIPSKKMKKVRALYYSRKKELEEIWFKKAKKHIIDDKIKEAIKCVQMIKDKDPIKHIGLNPKKWVSNFERKLKI